jgi:hypothetical protein
LTSLCIKSTVQLYQLFVKEKTTDSVYFVVVIYVVHGRSAKLNALSDARNGLRVSNGATVNDDNAKTRW